MGWGPSHQGGPSFLSQTSVETPAETHPEVCRLLDSKSSCQSRLSITAFWASWKRTVIDSLLAQGPEARERTRDFFLPLGPPHLGSVSSVSTSSVFSSQPQISSSSINVRVASERLSHLNLPDFLNYKWYLHIICIYSSVMPKAKATVSTEYRVSISYKLNTLQFSLFPFFCFTLGFPIMGFALVTPSPNPFAHFKAQACLLSK